LGPFFVFYSLSLSVPHSSLISGYVSGRRFDIPKQQNRAFFLHDVLFLSSQIVWTSQWFFRRYRRSGMLHKRLQEGMFPRV
ncbi:hypothetical protein K5M49_27190, partial [Serratia marcescens]|nr:hypothetical protein [Serratia marcescens]